MSDKHEIVGVGVVQHLAGYTALKLGMTQPSTPTKPVAQNCVGLYLVLTCVCAGEQ